MIRRLLIPSAALLLFSSLPALAQRPGQQQVETRADVYIRVTYDDDRPVPEMFRVQLMTSGRMPMTEQFTNDRGQVMFHGIGEGSYQVVITGQDIETAEYSFAVNPHESSHYEYVRTKRKPLTGPTSNEGTISAATLNIPDKAHKEFEKGLAAFDKQDFDVAREHFSKAVEIYPAYCAAYLNLGVIAMHSGQIEEGKKLFERAIQADNRNPSAYTYLARVQFMASKYDEAESLLAKALVITPFDPEPLTLLANAQYNAGQYDLAIVTARKVHNLPHEHYSIAHLIAAQALEQKKQPELAADEYRLFLKESPAGPNVDVARAALQSIENRPR